MKYDAVLGTLEGVRRAGSTGATTQEAIRGNRRRRLGIEATRKVLSALRVHGLVRRDAGRNLWIALPPGQHEEESLRQIVKELTE